MAHELEIREDGSAAAFMGRTPGWHGLGVVVDDDNYDMEQALLMSRMRYEFSLTPTVVEVDGRTVPVANDKHAVLRRNIDDPSDIRAFGGSLSEKYKVHTLLDMWGWIDEVLGEGAKVETLGNLHDGAQSFVTVRMPQGALQATHNDEVAMYLTVSTRHDGGGSTTASVSPVRVVCANTLAAADTAAVTGRVSVRHNIDLAEASEEAARRVLRIADRQAEEVEALYSTLKTVELDAAAMEKIVHDLFPIPEHVMKKSYDDMTTGEKRQFSLGWKARTGVMDLQESSPYRAEGSDGWSLYQAAVEYADYYAPVKGKDLDKRRAERVLAGKADGVKTRALDLILARA